MQVAAILDQYTVALTRDDDRTLSVGDIVSLREPVEDPEREGELLGHYEKLRLKITEVQERMYLAETYRITPSPRTVRGMLEIENAPVVTVNIGDVAIPL